MRRGHEFRRAPVATLAEGRADGHALLVALLRDLPKNGVQYLCAGRSDDEIDRAAIQKEFDKLVAIADRLEPLFDQPRRLHAQREAERQAKREAKRAREKAEAQARAERERAAVVLDGLKALAQVNPEGARQALEGVVSTERSRK